MLEFEPKNDELHTVLQLASLVQLETVTAGLQSSRQRRTRTRSTFRPISILSLGRQVCHTEFMAVMSVWQIPAIIDSNSASLPFRLLRDLQQACSHDLHFCQRQRHMHGCNTQLNSHAHFALCAQSLIVKGYLVDSFGLAASQSEHKQQ